jgi:hypothetical protein
VGCDPIGTNLVDDARAPPGSTRNMVADGSSPGRSGGYLREYGKHSHRRSHSYARASRNAATLSLRQLNLPAAEFTARVPDLGWPRDLRSIRLVLSAL